MKILSIAACLAFTSMVVAESGKVTLDPTPTDQPPYAWVAKVDTLSDEQLLVLRDMIAENASEHAFRKLYLAGPASKPDGVERLIPLPPLPIPLPSLPIPLPSLPIPGLDLVCGAVKTVLLSALRSLSALLQSISNFPVLGAVFSGLNMLLQLLIGLLDHGALGSSPHLFDQIATDLKMFEKLVSFAVVANVPKMADVLQGLSNVTTNLDTLSNCKDCKKQDEVARFQSKATNSPSPLDQTRCYAAADVYRAAVDDAIRRFPVTKDDSNDASGSAQNQEPKMRLVEGTRSVLDLMSKYTIPPENENLSKSRAVLYVGDLLEQYRSQLEPLAITEEEKLFMRVSLPALVGTSNALEACLYIAANPEVVGQDVEKELEEDEDNE